MAEGDRTLRGEARTPREKTGFGQKVWCFVFGHDEENWEIEVNYRFDPPVTLSGAEVSEVGPISETEAFCGRCGKLPW